MGNESRCIASVKDEFGKVNLFSVSFQFPPQPLFRTQLKLTKDWGIRITTIHSDTKNIQPWFHIFLVSFFGANKGCVGALYWAKHQIFPIFLLSQYTQCDIFFFLGTQYIAQKIPISMQNATIWMGTF